MRQQLAPNALLRLCSLAFARSLPRAPWLFQDTKYAHKDRLAPYFGARFTGVHDRGGHERHAREQWLGGHQLMAPAASAPPMTFQKYVNKVGKRRMRRGPGIVCQRRGVCCCHRWRQHGAARCQPQQSYLALVKGAQSTQYHKIPRVRKFYS